jgi:hypothetical protein
MCFDVPPIVDGFAKSIEVWGRLGLREGFQIGGRGSGQFGQESHEDGRKESGGGTNSGYWRCLKLMPLPLCIWNGSLVVGGEMVGEKIK